MILRKQDTVLPTANHPHISLRGCPRLGEYDTTRKSLCCDINDMQHGLVLVVSSSPTGQSPKSSSGYSSKYIL